MLVLIVKSLRIDQTGARVEFAGGHVLEYRREVEAQTPPSLPPLAKCKAVVEAEGELTADNVIPLIRRAV